MKGGVYRMLTQERIKSLTFSFGLKFLWLINKLLLFGVKHHLIVRFQVYFYRSELLGEVL